MSHPIENIMRTTMEQLKSMVDVNTIVGEPVKTGSETAILPVSKVCLGFMSGGGEYDMKSQLKKCSQAVENEESEYPFAGISVAGMSLTPMAFVTVNDSTVKVHTVNYSCPLDRVIEMVPQTIEQVEKLIRNTKNENNDKVKYTVCTESEEVKK